MLVHFFHHFQRGERNGQAHIFKKQKLKSPLFSLPSWGKIVGQAGLFEFKSLPTHQYKRVNHILTYSHMPMECFSENLWHNFVSFFYYLVIPKSGADSTEVFITINKSLMRVFQQFVSLTNLLILYIYIYIYIYIYTHTFSFIRSIDILKRKEAEDTPHKLLWTWTMLMT